MAKKSKTKARSKKKKAAPKSFLESLSSHKYFSLIGLTLICLFSFYLRFENFVDWSEKKAIFQYQGEYQMGNFDSYYYLQVAKSLSKGEYDAVDKKRRFPNGVKEPLLPPMLSILGAAIHKLTGIPLATLAIFLPGILSTSLALLVFFLCKALQLHPLSSLTASLLSILSLSYTARTRLGVFDTDCLNVILVLLNSYLIYLAVLNEKKKYYYLLFAALNTLFFYFWWNTGRSVVLLSFLAPFSVAAIFFIKSPKALIRYSAVLALGLFCLYLVGDQIQAYYNLLVSSELQKFPKNFDIGELEAVTISLFIEKSIDNALIVAVSVLGIILFTIKKALSTLIFILPLTLAVSPFLIGNRFIIFSAPIMALGVAYALQFVLDRPKKIKPGFALLLSLLLIGISIWSNHPVLTDGYTKPAAFDNMPLLTTLKQNTPPDASIWTDKDIGYQIRYYLDRANYADGEFVDGELYFYLYYPLAVNHLALAGNFMQFYSVRGIEGMRVFHSFFSDTKTSFQFIEELFSKQPSEAKIWLKEQEEKGKLPTSEALKNVDDWLSFLYPKLEKPVYLLLYRYMTQTAAWFKQGHADLASGKTIGLPLFMDFTGLREVNAKIGNPSIIIDPQTGRYMASGKQGVFRYIGSYGIKNEIKYFTPNGQITDSALSYDKRFVFQWRPQNGYGVVLSDEMADTVFIQLYIQQKASSYFQLVASNPIYQIWKVQGDKID